MKVSVVIPVYNGADFIQKSYHSIIDQCIDDYEILYVDNNSKDNSAQQIEHLIANDSRVKLFFQTKQGAAAARNMGIKNAKGDYVYVFDVDDEIYPNALHAMIQVLDDYPAMDAVFGKMVKSNQGILNTKKPTDETNDVILKEKPYWGIYWFSSLKNVVGPPAFLYKRRVFESIGMYNESIRNNEDTALDIKLGMTCNLAFLDRYVYLYFKHETSTIQTSKREMPRAFMVWPRLVREHLPFYLEHDTPIRFKQLLFSQLFQSMGRQIVFTKGFSERLQLKKRLINEISSVKIPLSIRIYLVILAVFPISFLKKIYGYFVVPFAIKPLPKQK